MENPEYNIDTTPGAKRAFRKVYSALRPLQVRQQVITVSLDTDSSNTENTVLVVALSTEEDRLKLGPNLKGLKYESTNGGVDRTEGYPIEVLTVPNDQFINGSQSDESVASSEG